MKTNAIIRIVIWSLVIIVLSSILLGAISYSHFRFNTSSTMIKQEPQADEGLFTGRTENALGLHGEVSAANIRKIAIEWVAGDILILPKDDIDTIRFAEETTSDSRYQMVWKESGEKLTIRFCEESFNITGFSLGDDIVKDLTIEVPAEWVCQELELDVASANLTVQSLMLLQVDFDGASGTCDFLDCTIGDLDMDTASGDVTFQGSLDMLDFDAASASFTGRFDNTPSRIDVDGMSGDVELILPADGGYTVSMDGMSSSFTAESHLTETKNGLHIYGNGRCRIDMDGMSCNLLIRLHNASSGSVPSHHIHTESCQTDPDTCPDHYEEHHAKP